MVPQRLWAGAPTLPALLAWSPPRAFGSAGAPPVRGAWVRGWGVVNRRGSFRRRELAAVAYPPRLLPLEGAGCPKGRLRVLGAGAYTVSGRTMPGAENDRPHRPAITPTISQATPASFLPRWGKKPFCWLLCLGTANAIRLLPKEGAAPKGLRVHALGNRPSRLRIQPHTQGSLTTKALV